MYRKGSAFFVVFCLLARFPSSCRSVESSPRTNAPARRYDGTASAYKKGQVPLDLHNTNARLKLEAQQLAKEIEMKRFRENERARVQNKQLYEEGQKLQDKANKERHRQYKQMMEQLYGPNVMSDPQVGIKAHLKHVEQMKKERTKSVEQMRHDQDIFDKLMTRKRMHGSVYLAKIKNAANEKKAAQANDKAVTNASTGKHVNR